MRPFDATSPTLQIIRQPSGVRFRFFPAGLDRALLTVSVPDEWVDPMLAAAGDVPVDWATIEDVKRPPVFRGRVVAQGGDCTLALDDRMAGISTAIACRQADLPELVADLANATDAGLTAVGADDLRRLFAAGPRARYHRFHAEDVAGLLRELGETGAFSLATGVLGIYRMDHDVFGTADLEAVTGCVRDRLAQARSDSPSPVQVCAAPWRLSLPRHRRHPLEASLIAWRA